MYYCSPTNNIIFLWLRWRLSLFFNSLVCLNVVLVFILLQVCWASLIYKQFSSPANMGNFWPWFLQIYFLFFLFLPFFWNRAFDSWQVFFFSQFFRLVFLKWTTFKFQEAFCHLLSAVSPSSEFFRYYIFHFSSFWEFLISLLRFHFVHSLLSIFS